MVVALATSGCSRAVVIPREQVAAEEYRKPGSYRIRLHGWNEYYAKRFSMTDSTVVIQELLHTDDHFKLTRHEMPIVIPLKDVQNISVMETNWPATTVVLVGMGVGLAYFAYLAILFAGLSGMN